VLQAVSLRVKLHVANVLGAALVSWSTWRSVDEAVTCCAPFTLECISARGVIVV
jgi:hypothetical protein